MEYKYAKEKPGKAVRYLAIGERDVRDRLRVVSKDMFDFRVTTYRRHSEST